MRKQVGFVPALVLGLVLGAAFFAGLSACSSGGGSNDAGGSGGSGGGDDGGGADLNLTDYSCQQIRTCASACADAACIETCATRGTTEAQALFQALVTCVTTQPANCALDDFVCVCNEGCLVDGYCVDQTTACAGDVPEDLVCNMCR